VSDPGLFTVHQGDARHMARLLEKLDEPNGPPLTCTVTSPPYGQMKDYGHRDQIGFGQPYDEYMVEMRRIFRQVYQHTRADGSLWIVADTLRADGTTGNDGLPPLEPLPFQLADQAADSGWILREVIIWQKHRTLPWSSGRRLRNAFEYVLLFAKSDEYKFRLDRIRETETLTDWWVKWPERYNPNGKVPTNVWDIPIPVQGSWKTPAVQHACPLPPALVERLILLSTDPGDIVFDPFAGTGVVVAEAECLGRRGLGIELNRRYVVAFSKAVRPAVLKRSAAESAAERAARTEALRQDIIRLRALKYPKVLFQELSKQPSMRAPQLIALTLKPFKSDTLMDASRPIKVQVVFAYDDATTSFDLDEANRQIKGVANRQPATKFGVASETIACRMKDFSSHVKKGPYFLYEGGRTWTSSRRVRPKELANLETSPPQRGRYTYPPLVANVEVHVDPRPGLRAAQKEFGSD